MVVGKFGRREEEEEGITGNTGRRGRASQVYSPLSCGYERNRSCFQGTSIRKRHHRLQRLGLGGRWGTGWAIGPFLMSMISSAPTDCGKKDVKE